MLKLLAVHWKCSLFFFFLLFINGFPAIAGDDPARALAEAVYNRPAGKDVTSRVSMILTGKGVETRTRQLALFRMDKGAGERWSLMRFSLPADIKDTGLLTLDHPGDESDQWIYLPALDRVRRISSSRKGGRFVGSDFTYEDLRDREPDMDNHKIIGQSKVGGIKCEVVVSTPIDKSNSIYSKRVSWIHRRTRTALRVDFYQSGARKPVKRLMARKLKKTQGYWTVLESTMYDLKTGHKTKLATSKVKYDQGLPESLFSRQGLADASRGEKYIP
ncbi:MAG: outer membrane lipoprotein-sorting protein [Sedimenticola sp.]